VNLQISENAPLAPRTTMGVGGMARFLATARSRDEIREALSWAERQALSVQILGGGSNTIFRDGGFVGLVLVVGNTGVRFEDDGKATRVTAAAGEDWDSLVESCVSAGLSGIECLSGIPGTVGATPIQNVGAYGQEVAETIESVRVLNRSTLEEAEMRGSECGFAYRHSRFKSEDRGRFVIIAVTYRLQRERRPELRSAELVARLEELAPPNELAAGQPFSSAVREAVLAVRRRKSMVVDAADPDSHSAGSFFLNPILSADELESLRARWADLGQDGEIPAFEGGGGWKVPAAWLVEGAGFPRGMRQAGAGLSSQHALALISCGGNAGDVLDLAHRIETAVQARFGVRLVPEPEIVPSLASLQTRAGED